MSAWFWIAVCAPFAFGILFMAGVVIELAALIRRWIRLAPRIWDDSTRIAHAEFDSDGLLQALVYDGIERFFQPMESYQKHWVRRWERGRGIVWERRAAHARSGAVVAVDAVVVFPTREGMLRGVDASSGAMRWQVELGLEDLMTTLAAGSVLLVAGRNTGADSEGWIQIDARDGSVLARGRSRRDAIAEQLGAKPPGAAVESGTVLLQRMLGHDAGNDGRPNHAVMIRTRDASPDQDYPIGPGSDDSSLEAVQALGPTYAVYVRNVWRDPDGLQALAVIIDPVRGRLLAQLGQSRARVLAKHDRWRGIRV